MRDNLTNFEINILFGGASEVAYFFMESCFYAVMAREGVSHSHTERQFLQFVFEFSTGRTVDE